MDDETRAEIERAYREHAGAKAWEEKTREALFQAIQDILDSGRATIGELAAATKYTAERVRQIGKGEWYRSPKRRQ